MMDTERAQGEFEEGTVYVWIRKQTGMSFWEDRLCVRAPVGALRKALSGVVGARWDGATQAWHIAASVEAWGVMRALLDELWAGPVKLGAEVEKLREEARSRAVGTAAKTADALADLPTKTVGWLHQRRAFHFARGLRSAGLFLDMGGGKSAVAIGLCEEWQAKQVVILCPKSVMGVWPKQFAMHATRDWSVHVASSTMTVARKTDRAFEWYVRPTSPSGRPKVLIVNYDAGWRDLMDTFLLKIVNSETVLVLDESHKIKAPGGKASMFCAKLGKAAGRVLLLTGTPMPYGFQDIYAQYRAADASIYGTSFQRFKTKYAHTIPIREHVDKIVGFRTHEAEAEFVRKMGSIGIVISRDEMDLDVPGRERPVERTVALDKKTWRLYQELKNELVAEVDAGIVTADNALTKLLRLRQITSGHIKTEDGVVTTVGSEKAKLLEDVLDDLPRDRPVVVFGVFHHDLDCIRKVAEGMGLDYGELSGRRRDGLADDSTLAPMLDVVGVQLQSGGVGVDFTRACIGIYYSIDYNLGNVEQSFARLDRPGQTVPVTFIHLVTTSPTGEATVDGVTYKALHERRQLNEAVIEALKNKEM